MLLDQPSAKAVLVELLRECHSETGTVALIAEAIAAAFDDDADIRTLVALLTESALT